MTMMVSWIRGDPRRYTPGYRALLRAQEGAAKAAKLDRWLKSAAHRRAIARAERIRENGGR